MTCSVGRLSHFIQFILCFVVFKAPGHSFLQQLTIKDRLETGLKFLSSSGSAVGCFKIGVPTAVLVLLVHEMLTETNLLSRLLLAAVLLYTP